MSLTVGQRVGLVVAGMLLMQVGWVLAVAPFRGSDEIDHVYRAAAVAGGEWLAGDYADDGRGWLVTVPGSLVEAARAQCERLASSGPDNCEGAGPAKGEGEVLVASSAGNYHPAYYWVVGVAGAPFEGATSLYAMRAASALLCLVFLGLAAWASLRRLGRWTAAGLVLAASPVLVYSTTVVAPNGLELAAALSLWASLLAVPDAADDRAERLLLWTAIASAVVMGSLRLIGPLFVLLILGTVLVLHGHRLLDVPRRRRATAAAGAVLVALSVAQFAWWTFGPLRPEPATDGPDGSPVLELGNLVLWPLQSIAAFPYRNQMGPVVVYMVVGALVMTLVVLAFRGTGPRGRLVLMLAVGGAFVLPVLLTLATMDGRGVIWQGRYGLPYGAGFVLLAGHLADRGASSARLPWLLVVPSALALAAGVGASLVKVRNNALSVLPPAGTHGAWPVPDPVLLVALSLLAMTCFAAAVGGGPRERA